MKTRPIAHSSDKDLPLETAHLSTSSSTAPAGWKLVPAEPTWEMIDAFFANPRARDESWKEAYRDMLAAAPPPPTTEQSSAVQQPQVEQELCCESWSVNRIDDLGKIVGSSGRLIATVYGLQAEKIVACHNSYTRPQPRREPLTDEQRKDAERYRYLRAQPIDCIDAGGIFCGKTPENLVVNGADLDAAVDAAIGRADAIQPSEPAYLLRDLAADIGVKALDLIATIRAAGLGYYSVNMMLPAKVCVAMCRRFAAAPQPPAPEQPQGERDPDEFYEWWGMRPSLTRLQTWLLWKDQAKAEGGAA